MKKFKQNLQTGLTLIETLVAITVLIVGVLGPLNIAARGIGDGIFAANQLAANYLAQEALELVINKRYALARQAQYSPPVDPATLFNGYVDSQFSGCVGLSATDYCSVNVATGAIVSNPVCNNSDSSECKLVYNTAAGFYQKPTLGPVEQNIGTIFIRKVKMVGVSPNELKVSVTVEWNNKDVPKSLTIVEHLFTKG